LGIKPPDKNSRGRYNIGVGGKIMKILKVLQLIAVSAALTGPGRLVSAEGSKSSARAQATQISEGDSNIDEVYDNASAPEGSPNASNALYTNTEAPTLKLSSSADSLGSEEGAEASGGGSFLTNALFIGGGALAGGLLGFMLGGFWGAVIGAAVGGAGGYFLKGLF
jgi:hypothetical protein